ncbi:hypothetical protein J2R78_008671 [Bradyrhizobium sp. USDA 4538]|uniref:hypothetical protein n=1 Tax=unclassified Bradyrhizobium TaxID=2631580 RepID=UPI00209D5AB7|nr:MULTISPECIES: hypothetical protein [unclassified Bradyrhizobium]MCP1845637.1 hypothetical protein [Bradyrhizobium sp. USDA 4538]MCP1907039.1 hypothetical protein [Bradyrhizobium sp. USDA 4537]MCP1985515.1 hypothetical protein [Bradyrhizobium sp. USDA 4539]
MSDVTIHGSPYKNANSDYDPDGKGVYLEKGTRFKGSNLTINADLTGIQLLGGNNSVSLTGHNTISMTGVPQKGFGV